MTGHVSRTSRVLSLSLPIVFVMLAQNLMSLVDVAMIGRLGAEQLAAVGIGGAMLSVLLALLFGLDAGVQAIAARRAGQGGSGKPGLVLNEALSIALLLGVTLATAGLLGYPYVFRLVSSEPAVVAYGSAYLGAVLPMMAFVGINYAVGAYWNGTGVPQRTLGVILVQLVCNVVLNYGLIYGNFGLPRMETAGAGLGTLLSALIALALHLSLAWRWARPQGFLQCRPRWETARKIITIGLPISAQQSSVYVGASVYLGIVALLGTAHVAAVNVLTVILLVAILSATGMGVGAATLVGQALGGGDVNGARRWGWETARLTALGIAVFSLGLLAWPETVLRVFVERPEVVALGVMPLRILALGIWLDALGRVLAFALRGTGATGRVALVSFTIQWFLTLPLSWYVGVELGFGLEGIAVCRTGLMAVEAFVMALMWHLGGWSRISIGPESSAALRPDPA